MKIKIKRNPVSGLLYVPKRIAREWGNEYVLLPNNCAGVLYPKGSNMKDVVRSLRAITALLEVELEGEGAKTPSMAHGSQLHRDSSQGGSHNGSTIGQKSEVPTW